LSEAHVIAMSIMAGGYQDLDQAFQYLRTLPRLSGIAAGVSTKQHAKETFERLRMLSLGHPNLPTFHESERTS
jgi:hypothetical protein